MKYYLGKNKKKDFFEGWYLKHQNDHQTLAFIIGYQYNKQKEKEVFLQIATKKQTFYYQFTDKKIDIALKKLHIECTGLLLTEEGFSIDINTKDLSITGRLQYTAFEKLDYDIMGPFKFFPFMECHHGILSTKHYVSGEINLNGESFVFDYGHGYLEKDSGKSFPTQYMWTQCNNFNEENINVVAAYATIPFLGITFKGMIGDFFYRNKHYRLATYLGGKCLMNNDNHFTIIQKKYRLEIFLIESAPQILKAPKDGQMQRFVLESPQCTVRYCFYEQEKLIFDKTSSMASFEYSSEK